MGWEARCLDPRCRAQVAKEKWDEIIPKSVLFFSKYAWKLPPSDSLGELKNHLES